MNREGAHLWLMVDDAHAIGVLGGGRGTATAAAQAALEVMPTEPEGSSV